MKTSNRQENSNPPPPPPPDTNYYILLPYHHHHHHRCFPNLKPILLLSISILLLFLTIFLLFPSDPRLSVVRLHLNHLRLRTTPTISLDISMALTIKVRNPDFFSLNYNSLVVSIGYRGRKLGFVTSVGGVVKARRSSYVEAELTLNGIEVLHDVFYLLEDLARRSIPFDTLTEVKGELGFFFFKIPIKGKVSCEVYVNTSNQTIVRQDCYPE